MSKKQTLTTRGLRPPKRHLAKKHARVYWPYLPLVVLLLGGLFINIWQPLQSHKPATLAYATEMSRATLLSSTNAQRNSNGSASLTINSKLNAAAQAKANDMIARNYWSHNTPDGKAPWVFIDAQGYQYIKAGENLAYGFTTSNDTIIGWMNSPTHKANLLDPVFTEVGFGFANGANYVATGNETLVVAMYGKPFIAPAPVTTPVVVTPPKPTPQPAVQSETISANKPKEIQKPADLVVNAVPKKEDRIAQPITTDRPVPDKTPTKRITLLQQITGGRAPWSALAISIIGVGLAIFWLTKHYFLVRRYLIEGEHFVAHHPIFDLIVILIISIAVYFSQISGVIQ